MMPRFLFCMLFLFFNAATVFSQAEKAEAAIMELMKKRNVAGLSVAVVKNNQLVYTKAFGLKDIESNAPMTTETVFRIASISKSFSATSIMQLVEAGKLKLEDDFSKLIGFTIRNPKYPEKVITLKMVLSHTSSINDSQGYFNLDAINPATNVNWAQCYNSYEPGKGYQYCNLNFNMVGAVIEKQTGVRFDQYVKQNILNPLGLYGGYWVDDLDSNRFATLYEYDAQGKSLVPSPTAYANRREEIKNYVMGKSTPIFSPTGGMKISAPDLAKYMMMHMNYGKYEGGRIISKKSSKTMQTKLSEEEGYGLALLETNKLIPGFTMHGHTGSAYGLYSAMFFHPKEKFGFVVITNGCNPTSTNGFIDVSAESINILYKHLVAR